MDKGKHTVTRISEAEAAWLTEAARQYVPLGGTAIEIGSAFGYSAAAIVAGLPLGAVLHCIDPWTDGHDERYNDPDHEQRFDAWLAGANRHETVAYKAKQTSIQYFATLPDNQQPYIHFAHIDGDHGRAMADWNLVKRYLLPGGVVVFHDYPNNANVVEATERAVVSTLGFRRLVPPKYPLRFFAVQKS